MTDGENAHDINERLLEGAVKLAFEEDFRRGNVDNGVAEPSDALERRVRGRLRAYRLRVLAKKYYAAATACVMLAAVLTFAVLYTSHIAADPPVYSMMTESDGNMLTARFICRDEDAEVKKIEPRSASETLCADADATYRTDYTYIESYASGTVYEQNSLSGSGRLIVGIAGKTVKNIVVGGYPAVLVFGDGGSEIIWRDDAYYYRLSGAFSSDDAMRYARQLSPERGGE